MADETTTLSKKRRPIRIVASLQQLNRWLLVSLLLLLLSFLSFTTFCDAYSVLVVSSAIAGNKRSRITHNNHHPLWTMTTILKSKFSSSSSSTTTTTRLGLAEKNEELEAEDDDDKLLFLPDVDDLWQARMGAALNPYRSTILHADGEEWLTFLSSVAERNADAMAAANQNSIVNGICPSPTKQDNHHPNSFLMIDPFWEQIQMEARMMLQQQPTAGPQLYQGILSQPNLLTAIVALISHQIETELIPATVFKSLFLDLLTAKDEYNIRLDLQAVATRSPSVETAMGALLFHNGFHALVCYRLGHRLWQAGRTALAYYMQSTVSRKYSADIHPACRIGSSIYLRVGAGVVIGETAVVGNDVSILEGVTLGGTGKENGDRHPKVGHGVILYDGGTVLGNIVVGDGSVISAKSIVNKPVPPLAIVSGVPGKIVSYRDVSSDYNSSSSSSNSNDEEEESVWDDPLHHHLYAKYIDHWRIIASEQQQQQQQKEQPKQ